MFLGEKIFKGFTIYCHDSHIGNVNTLLHAFTEPNSKETCYNQLSPLEEITEVVEICVTKVKEFNSLDLWYSRYRLDLI